MAPAFQERASQVLVGAGHKDQLADGSQHLDEGDVEEHLYTAASGPLSSAL